MNELVLYHTLGCHLCDDAEVILSAGDIPYTKFDIINDDALVDEFGEMIPVLFDKKSNQYIAWPFNVTILREFVDHLKKNAVSNNEN